MSATQVNAHRKSAWASRSFRVLHHALAAGVMASAMLVLEHFGLLGWLDAAMLQIVAPRSTEAIQSTSSSLPQLLLIDNQAYAENFGLRSPLQRDGLSMLLGDALAAKPKTLLVDLQLEPTLDEPEARRLDRLLSEAAQSGTRIVLPVPISRTSALDRRAATWMRSLCQAGVQFGSASLRSHLGTIVRFDHDNNSMAALAGEDASEKHAASISPCQLLEKTGSLAGLQLLDAPEHAAPESEPLKPSAVRSIMAQSLAWRLQGTRQGLQARKPETIVIGGDYDDRDTFLTHARQDPVPGAAVHAAIIASWGKIDSSHFVGWFADLIIGCVLGFLFEFLWCQAGRLRNKKKQQQESYLRLFLREWPSLLVSCGIWLIALGLAFSSMLGSGAMIERGLWLNPGPMVLGMFLHALLLKDAGHEAHSPLTLREFTLHCPSWPLQSLVVLAAITYLMLHTFHH